MFIWNHTSRMPYGTRRRNSYDLLHYLRRSPVPCRTTFNPTGNTTYIILGLCITDINHIVRNIIINIISDDNTVNNIGINNNYKISDNINNINSNYMSNNNSINSNCM